jgi:hypothetical protein
VTRGLSESQSRALYERDAPFTEAHRNSWTARFDRGTPPSDLRELVRDLRRAYTDEVPTRIHSRDTDAGGDPAWSPEFTRYLTGSDSATDARDPGSTEVYLTPFRACMASMERSTDQATRKRAAIVSHVVIGNYGPVEAAILEGLPDWDAKRSAEYALTVFWRRLSDVRLDLRKTETAA